MCVGVCGIYEFDCNNDGEQSIKIPYKCINIRREYNNNIPKEIEDFLSNFSVALKKK